MKRLSLAALLLATTAHASPAGRVAGSKHDLSSRGPGAYRASTETDPCIFCHVTHRGGPGLSNRPETVRGQRPYESSSLSFRAPPPTGASRICLSCHDGTIAVGRTRKKSIDMVGGNRPLTPGSRANLGTDLRGTHPISIPGAGAGVKRKVRPPGRDAVQLDSAGLVQCTSCHDPHAEWGDPVVGKFLVKPLAASSLCQTCHEPEASPHATSVASLAVPIDGATTVGAAGCSACHPSHGADKGGRLLAPTATDDEPCLACHAGNVARSDIASDVRKASAHLSGSRGVHDREESPTGSGRHRLPEDSAGTARHVACVDCHDPHAANRGPASAPAASRLLAGVWGISIEGLRVDPVRFEYEVCLKCHGDSANLPQFSPSGLDGVRRARPDRNLRKVFDPGAPSSHPIVAPGHNPDVPSLKPPYTAASIIYCTDCHASDSGAGAGGTGPRGPHGSIYPRLLERQYLMANGTTESPTSYALCYKCHDRERLLSITSPFSLKARDSIDAALHWRHVVKASTPCSACHAAHGVSADAGDARRNAHLVSFDLAIVGAGTSAAPEYETAGTASGSCNLTCHGRKHDAANAHY